MNVYYIDIHTHELVRRAEEDSLPLLSDFSRVLMTSHTHKRSTHTCLTSDTILMTNHCTKRIVSLAVLVVQQHSLHTSHKNNNYVHIYVWIYTRYVFRSISDSYISVGQR